MAWSRLKEPPMVSVEELIPRNGRLIMWGQLGREALEGLVTVQDEETWTDLGKEGHLKRNQ